MLQDITSIGDKYKLFIEKTAASKQVWALQNKQGWANTNAAGDDEATVIPFWSDRALAKASARDDWRSYAPVSIPLADFLENWCTEMAANDVLAGINWDANMQGNESNALNIALDILEQLNSISSAIAFSNYGSITEFINEISGSLEEE